MVRTKLARGNATHAGTNSETVDKNMMMMVVVVMVVMVVMMVMVNSCFV